MLTASLAPASARQANVSQNDRDKPNTTVASAVSARPPRAACGRAASERCTIGTMATLPATAPTAEADDSQP